MPSNRRIALAKGAACCAAAGALLWCFPPFHVVPLASATQTAERAARGGNGLTPQETAVKLWDQQLLPASKKALDARTLLADLQGNPRETREKLGRSVGLGGACYYFVAGEGRVVARGAHSISLALAGSPAETPGGADIVIDTGILFGNAIRDGSGLVDVSAFQNSQDYNDLSSALNQLAETRVFPLLREKGLPGTSLHFAGIVEVADESTDLPPHPLRLVPILAELVGATRPAGG
jgi:predicted lipoprotein